MQYQKHFYPLFQNFPFALQLCHHGTLRGSRILYLLSFAPKPNLSHPSYYLTTNIFHFFVLNSNISPSNANVTLSLVQNLHYCITLDIFFEVLLEKTALLYLYRKVLHFMVYRAILLPIPLTYLVRVSLLSLPRLFRLHPRHFIPPITFCSRLMSIFRFVTSTKVTVDSTSSNHFTPSSGVP